MTETPAIIDATELRRCLGSFVTGVTVITAIDDKDELQGMTANSFSSVSLDPPLIVWSLRKNSTSFDAYSKAPRFVVNILAQEQVHISNLFARPGIGRFDSIRWSPGLGGVPLIDGSTAHIECKVEATYPGGDHVLFLGRVERIATGDKKPLAFGMGKYMVVQPKDHNVDFSGNVAALGAVQSAKSALDRLSQQTDMTVGLGVWGNFGPTMIWFNESSTPLDLKLRCGMVMPLLSSATGRVFAAYASETLTRPYLASELAVESVDPHKKRDLSDVHLELADIRARKIASVHESFLEGVFERPVNAVSVPVFDSHGDIVLAFTMMSHDSTFGESWLSVQALKSTAHDLSKLLGFSEIDQQQDS